MCVCVCVCIHMCVCPVLSVPSFSGMQPTTGLNEAEAGTVCDKRKPPIGPGNNPATRLDASFISQSSRRVSSIFHYKTAGPRKANGTFDLQMYHSCSFSLSYSVSLSPSLSLPLSLSLFFVHSLIVS